MPLRAEPRLPGHCRAAAGANATNKRITDLDDYVVQTTATVNFGRKWSAEGAR
jgi:hypothetical protein